MTFQALGRLWRKCGVRLPLVPNMVAGTRPESAAGSGVAAGAYKLGPPLAVTKCDAGGTCVAHKPALVWHVTHSVNRRGAFCVVVGVDLFRCVRPVAHFSINVLGRW